MPVRFTEGERAALRQLAARDATTDSALARDIICRELRRSGVLAPSPIEARENEQALAAVPPESPEPTADTTAARIDAAPPASPEADPVQPDIERNMTPAEIEAERVLHAELDDGM